MEKEKTMETVDFGLTFERLLDSQCFSWDKQTVKQRLSESTLTKAKEALDTLQQNLQGSTEAVVESISKRAESWGYSIFLDPYYAIKSNSLQTFSEIVSEKQKELKCIEIETPEIIGQKWVTKNLLYEASRIINRQEKAQEDLGKIEARTFKRKQNQLKATQTSDDYKDLYNKFVCLKADELGIRLPEASQIIDKQVLGNLSSEDFVETLSKEYESTNEKSLENSLKNLLKKGLSPEKGVKAAALLFEIDQLKTDEVWNGKRFEEVMLSGLNGEPVKLITMLCLINNFDYKGGYVCESDLFAYKENPRLEPIPIILDEFSLLMRLLEYYGIETDLTIFISDTDYTEIGQYGPVNQETIDSIKSYVKNVKDYLTTLSSKINVTPISEITETNPIYIQVKSKVLKQVSEMKDLDFIQEWQQKYEDAVEKIDESQSKKKLYQSDQLRKKSIEITRNIWACNAAQGAVFGTLAKNTILVSTEKRERDQNYTINKESRINFPPVLYVLKAAEEWNRKLTRKQT